MTVIAVDETPNIGFYHVIQVMKTLQVPLRHHRVNMGKYVHLSVDDLLFVIVQQPINFQVFLNRCTFFV